MNPEFESTREALETRLTALLLGELSAEEADALRKAIALDPELAQLHHRLKHTIGLVREATVGTGAQAAGAPAAGPLKLSDARRNALLQKFKTITPPEFAPRRRPLMARLVPLAAVAAIVLLLVAISIPNFTKARGSSTKNAVINNLRQIDGAKQQWALENHKSPNEVPTAADLAPYLRGGPMQPIAGETYKIGRVSEPVIAELDADKFGKSSNPLRLLRRGREETVQLSSDGGVVTVAPTSLAAEAARNFNFIETPPPQSTSPSLVGAAPAQSEQTAVSEGRRVHNIVLPAATEQPVVASTAPPVDGLGTVHAIDMAAADSVAPTTDQFTPVLPGWNGGTGGGGATPAKPEVAGVATTPGTQNPYPASTVSGDTAGRVAKAIEEDGFRRRYGLAPQAPASTRQMLTEKQLLPSEPGFVGTLEKTTNYLAFGDVNRNGAFSTGTRKEELHEVQPFPSALNLTNYSYSLGAGQWAGQPGGTSGAQTQPSRIDQAGDFFSQKVPMLGEVPVAGKMFQSGPGGLSGQEPAVATGSLIPEKRELANADDIPRGGDLNVGWLGRIAQPGSNGASYDLNAQYRMLNQLPAPEESSKLELPYGNVSPLTTGLPAGPGTHIVLPGQPWNPAIALRGYYKDSEGALADQSRRAATSGQAIASASSSPVFQQYETRQRELEELQRGRQSLERKIAAEGGDQSLPKSSTLSIVQQAEPGKDPTFWNRLAGYQAPAARVKIEPEQSGIIELQTNKKEAAAVYDPYFIQTEFEAIKSDPVLRRVAEDLKSDPQWAKKRGEGKPLSTEETIKLLRKNLEVQPEKNSQLVDIRVKSDSAAESAKLANKVAEAYRDYRVEERRRLSQESVKALKQQFDEQDKKVRSMQAEVAQLHAKSKAPGIPLNAGAPSPQVIQDKLNGIRLSGVQYDGLPLAEVINNLNEEIKKRDPEKRGLDLLINNPQPGAVDPATGELIVPVDPATGLPVSAAAEPLDLGAIPIKTNLAGREASLAEILDAVVKSSGTPLKYSIENYGVVISAANATKPADDAPKPKPAVPAPIPQPEIATSDNAFSTFSLNVSDVSFKLAAASLEKGQMPDAASIRSEEFINAFDYRDPEPAPGSPIAFAWERAHYPFAQNRDLLRLSLKTAAQGRQPGRPLNIVLLLDNSGSMERADRVQIIREALKVLAAQLQPQDKFSVVTFARTPRLLIDGAPGDQAAPVAEEVSGLTPEGGTNLEEAMKLAYQTATRHYLASGINRVVLLTDGAANLGNVDPDTLKQKVEAQRKQGVALDCFGIGWEGYNDDLLEVLSRNGDGRYGFINTPGEAATEFAGQLAGALQVAASDVKVQVEFNPKRVTVYRQIGYAKHQLTKEQFRDNTVDAAEIGAAEAGNALYTVEANPAGEGPLATLRVRYKVPGTGEYREQAWAVPYYASAPPLEQASPAMRLAASASAFSEWLAASPYAGEVSPDELLGYLRGVPEVYGADARPKKLEWMIRQVKSLQGR